MSDIKQKLKTLIVEQILPESEGYLSDLHKLLENQTATPDDKEAIKEMESFLVELENIASAIDDGIITDQESQVIFDKILLMLDQHKH